MTRSLAALTMLTVWAAVGCSTKEFVPEGPQRSLAEFDGIYVPALADKTSPKPAATEGSVSGESFLKTFPQELRKRLRSKGLLQSGSGPMVTFEGTLLRYDCEDRQTSYARDTLDNKGTIEIDIVLKDVKGVRIGGGKASGSSLGASPEVAMKAAEYRVLTVIRDYLRKHARAGSGPAEPDPDDDP